MGTNNSAPTSQTLLLNSTFSECQKLYDFIEGFTHLHGLSSETFQDLKLIAEEIFANIINHGYKKALDKKIEIVISVNSNDIEISFIDEASEYNPLEFKEESENGQELDTGGMGMRIIRSLTNTQNYQRVNERNVLTITKHYNG